MKGNLEPANAVARYEEILGAMIAVNARDAALRDAIVPPFPGDEE